MDVEPLVSYMRKHAGMTREQFVAKVPVPHLFFGNLPSLEESSKFQTLGPGVLNAGGGNTLWEGIVPLQKRDGNAFTMMITLGRAKNNDVIVESSSVSKFHAYFRQEGSKWTVTDANSTNGTLVDGIKLVPEKGHAVQSGTRITFSDEVSGLFLDPHATYDLLFKPGEFRPR